MLRKLGTAALLLVVCSGTAAWGQVKLALKYPPNTQEVSHVQVKTKQKLTLAGMDFDTDSSLFMVTTSRRGEPADDGKVVEDHAIDTLQADLSLPMGLKLQFDSGNPGKKADNALLEPLLDVFRTTASMPFKVTRGKDGKIEKFEYPAEKLDALPEAVKKEFDADKKKEAANQELGFLPDKEVKQGDTWERSSTTSLGGGQTMDFVTDYTYAGEVTEEGKTYHKITSKMKSVKYAMDPSAESPLKITGSELKPTESNGEYLLDLASGHLVKATSKVRIEGDLQCEVGGMALAGKLDLTIETTSKRQP